MEFHRVRLKLPHKTSHLYLEPLGDIHIGNQGVAYEKLRERIEVIRKDPCRYTIIMGDCIDNITAYAGGAMDRRWMGYNSLDKRYPEPEEQADEFVKLFEPIKDKILGIMIGNHEYKSWNRRRCCKDLVDPLGAKYLGYKCMIHISCLHDNKELGDFEVFAVHGSYAGQQIGGGINQLVLNSADNFADVYLMGHVHDKMTYSVDAIYHDLKTNRPAKKTRIFALTGTFLETVIAGVDGYADRKTRIRNAKIGTITIEYDPLQNKLHSHE